MKEIQYEIKREIAVLSTADSGYTKEINLISWNGAKPKYDIRSFSPNREKCGKGITLTKTEVQTLFAALKKSYRNKITPEKSVLLSVQGQRQGFTALPLILSVIGKHPTTTTS